MDEKILMTRRDLNRLLTQAKIDELRVNTDLHTIMKRSDRIQWSIKRLGELQARLTKGKV